MTTFIIILAVLVVLWIIKKFINTIARKSLHWETPVLLGSEIQDGSIFRQIILDDMNKKIANGATVTREGKEIPAYFRMDGRNYIYRTASPHYKVGEVYSTTAKYGKFILIVYIWIDKGWTHDAPYEIKY
jgi:hypothetical protein